MALKIRMLQKHEKHKKYLKRQPLSRLAEDNFPHFCCEEN